jgi:hypothetical protein
MELAMKTITAESRVGSQRAARKAMHNLLEISTDISGKDIAWNAPTERT